MTARNNRTRAHWDGLQTIPTHNTKINALKSQRKEPTKLSQFQYHLNSYTIYSKQSDLKRSPHHRPAYSCTKVKMV